MWGVDPFLIKFMRRKWWSMFNIYRLLNFQAKTFFKAYLVLVFKTYYINYLTCSIVLPMYGIFNLQNESFILLYYLIYLLSIKTLNSSSPKNFSQCPAAAAGCLFNPARIFSTCIWGQRVLEIDWKDTNVPHMRVDYNEIKAQPVGQAKYKIKKRI